MEALRECPNQSFIGLRKETRPKCPCLALYPQCYKGHNKVSPQRGCKSQGQKIIIYLDTYKRLRTMLHDAQTVEDRDVGHLGREKICNSSGSLETILHKVNVFFFLFPPPTKHQRFSDKASEDTPIREERALSIYILGRMVRIHGKEHSDLRSTRFSIIRHIFCIWPLGTVCLLSYQSFQGAEYMRLDFNVLPR